jgi:hypothetical protein
MHPVARYRQLATDYRRLAAIHTKPADKQALELFATGWDKAAENREAMLSSKEQAEPLINRRLHVRYFLRSLALARAAFAVPDGWRRKRLQSD